MGISIDSIWSKAQRLSASERLALSRRLRESVNESDIERQERTASEIDRFFGGWNEDPRSTEEIMQQIRDGRTTNLSLLPLNFFMVHTMHQRNIVNRNLLRQEC